MRRQALRKAAPGDLALADAPLLWGMGVLVVLGLVMEASASVSIADNTFGDPLHYFIRQLLFSMVGASGAVLVIRLPLSWLQRYSRLTLPGIFALLLLVFVPGLGYSVNGSLRWIHLGVVGFQVAEGAKLLFVIYMAGYLARHQGVLRERFSEAFKPLLLAGLCTGLLLLQPDFGSALILVAIAGGMVWLAGARLSHLFALASLGIPVLVLAAVAEPYRLRRLTSFLNPWADPFDGGFQLTQALIAIGRGEWLGVGLGGSVQKLSYLPEAHTDFVFSVLAEELGFIGVSVVLVLFMLVVWRGILIGLDCLRGGKLFNGYLAFGLALWLGMQAMVSIGVNLGVLPTKGLTLPFMSSGGSSLVTLWIAVALLLRVGIEQQRGAVARHGGRR